MNKTTKNTTTATTTTKENQWIQTQAG